MIDFSTLEVKLFLWDFNNCWLSETTMNYLIKNNDVYGSALRERFHDINSDYVKKWSERYKQREEAERKLLKDAISKSKKEKIQRSRK